MAHSTSKIRIPPFLPNCFHKSNPWNRWHEWIQLAIQPHMRIPIQNWRFLLVRNHHVELLEGRQSLLQKRKIVLLRFNYNLSYFTLTSSLTVQSWDANIVIINQNGEENWASVVGNDGQSYVVEDLIWIWTGISISSPWILKKISRDFGMNEIFNLPSTNGSGKASKGFLSQASWWKGNRLNELIVLNFIWHLNDSNAKNKFHFKFKSYHLKMFYILVT